MVQVSGRYLLDGRGDGVQRLEYPAGHEPAEQDRGHRHDGQRDAGLDQEQVEGGGVRGGTGPPELSATDMRRVRQPGQVDLLYSDSVVLSGGWAAEKPRGQGGDLVIPNEHVGDGKQAGAAEKKQATVERGEAQPHGMPGQAAGSSPGG